MSTKSFDTNTKTSTPLPDCGIDDALIEFRYGLATHWCPSHGVCIPSPASPMRFCSLPLRTVQMGIQSVGIMKSGATFFNISTVSRARCAGALSWHQHYKVRCVCWWQMERWLSCCSQPHLSQAFCRRLETSWRKHCEMTVLYDKVSGGGFLDHGIYRSVACPVCLMGSLIKRVVDFVL